MSGEKVPYDGVARQDSVDTRGGAAKGDGEGGSETLAESIPDLAAPPSPPPDETAAPIVLVQGVRVPHHVPLHWLWSACAHPDGWLYASVVYPSSVATDEAAPAAATPMAAPAAAV